MPRVTRQFKVQRRYGGEEIREEKVNLSWKELTKPEKRGVIKRRFFGTIATIFASTLVIGQPGETISPQEGANEIRTQAIDYYRGLSVIDKYETSYLSPKTFETVDGKGGSGFSSIHGAYYASLGQSCLANSAYDTRPSTIRGRSSGQISAVASLSMQGGNAVVTPYGASGLAVLTFTLSNGELVPTADSANTLSANRCQVEGGISMSRGADEFGGSKDNQTYKLIPAIRPEELA